MTTPWMVHLEFYIKMEIFLTATQALNRLTFWGMWEVESRMKMRRKQNHR